MLRLLSFLTGIVWKVYDDVSDDDSWYHIDSWILLSIIKLLVVTCAFILMYHDIPFLLLMVVTIVSNVFNRVCNYIYDYGYENVIDTNVWKFGQCSVLLLFYLRYSDIMVYINRYPNYWIWTFNTILCISESIIRFTKISKIITRIVFVLGAVLIYYYDISARTSMMFSFGYLITSITNNTIKLYYRENQK